MGYDCILLFIFKLLHLLTFLKYLITQVLKAEDESFKTVLEKISILNNPSQTKD